MTLQFDTAELDMIYNTLSDSLEEKKTAFARVADAGFQERDFGIPQIKSILDKIEAVAV